MATYTFEVTKTITLNGEITVDATSEDAAWVIAEEEAASTDAFNFEVIDEDYELDFISVYGEDEED